MPTQLDLFGAQTATTEPVPESRYRAQYGIIVICHDERHQQAVYAELKDAGHICRVVCT